MDGHCPFLCYLPYHQIKEFQQRLFGGESPFSLGDFAHLPVHPLDGIGGVDHPAHITVVFEERGKVIPVLQPGPD